MAEIKTLSFAEGVTVAAPALTTWEVATPSGSNVQEVVNIDYLASLGISGLNNISATMDPAVTDDSGDGYTVGSRWVNVTADTHWIALDVTVGAAIWEQTVSTTHQQFLQNKTLEDSTVQIVDQGDNTKKIAFQASGITTANTRTITMVDTDITIVGAANTQTLSNKTFDTVTNFTNVTNATSKDTGSIVTEGGIGVEQDIFVGGHATITGNLTVNGTTTTLNTATVDAEDTNITLNVGGNDASAEGGGLTINRTSTDGSLVYEDALASKWKAGALGSEIQLVNVSSTQTLTNKTADALKADVYLDLQGVTTPATPAAGYIRMHASTDGESLLYVSDGATPRTVATIDQIQLLSNKTLQDSSCTFVDNGDTSKQMAFQVSGVSTATTRTVTMIDADLTIVGLTNTQTLTNKTLTTPVLTTPQVDDAATFEQIATPSNPSSGFNKIYPKSDNFWYGLTSGGVETQFASTGAPLVAYVKDEKTSGTNGGSGTASTWNTRDLNTLTGDTSFISVSSNQITLDAGTYDISWSAPSFQTTNNQTRLQNITDTSTTIVGSTERSASTDSMITRSMGMGRFTIAGSKAFEIQHNIGTTSGANTFGPAASFTTEVYTMVRVEKVA